jgi:hypothetical protein
MFLSGDSPAFDINLPRFWNAVYHLHRWCKLLAPRMKMERKQCCKTSARKIQTPGNHLKERIRHSEISESLVS